MRVENRLAQVAARSASAEGARVSLNYSLVAGPLLLMAFFSMAATTDTSSPAHLRTPTHLNGCTCCARRRLTWSALATTTGTLSGGERNSFARDAAAH